MSIQIEGATEWVPEWSGEQLVRFNELKVALKREISLLREVRNALSLSQVETAHILSMTQSNISKIERGDPSVSILVKIAEAKGLKVNLSIVSPDGQPKFAITL